MENARRQLCYWLLTAFLEKGCDPGAYARRRSSEPVHRSRVLRPEEYRALFGGPEGLARAQAYARLRFLPPPPPVSEAPPVL